VLRLVLARDGSVERASVDRDRSTPAYAGTQLESCALAAFREQRFPAPRGDAEVLLEVPLEFRPPK
jgi:hypothetical protein